MSSAMLGRSEKPGTQPSHVHRCQGPRYLSPMVGCLPGSALAGAWGREPEPGIEPCAVGCRCLTTTPTSCPFTAPGLAGTQPPSLVRQEREKAVPKSKAGISLPRRGCPPGPAVPSAPAWLSDRQESSVTVARAVWTLTKTHSSR